MEQRRDWDLTETMKWKIAIAVLILAGIFLAAIMERSETAAITDMGQGKALDGSETYQAELDNEIWIHVSQMSYDRLSVGDVCRVAKKLFSTTWSIEVCW